MFCSRHEVDVMAARELSIAPDVKIRGVGKMGRSTRLLHVGGCSFPSLKRKLEASRAAIEMTSPVLNVASSSSFHVSLSIGSLPESCMEYSLCICVPHSTLMLSPSSLLDSQPATSLSLVSAARPPIQPAIAAQPKAPNSTLLLTSASSPIF